ncbi:MAG: hypothetical protein ACK40Q_03525 [Pseudothermotoga sp.]
MVLNIYDSDYLIRIHKMQKKRRNIIRLLGKLGNWSDQDGKVFVENLIGPLKKRLKETSLDLLQDSLFELFDKDLPLMKRLERLSKELSVSALECLELVFWVKPASYPPPTDEMFSVIETNDLTSFVSKARRILKQSMLMDFIELQAALMKPDENHMNWLIDEINDMTLQNCSEIESYRKLYYDLNVLQRADLNSKLRCHPYIKAALMRKAEAGVVLDGNNIFMLRKRFSDIEFVLQKIAYNDPFYYPFWIVFDKNIVYLVEKEDTSAWLESPSVFLHSPADELILWLAKQNNAVIVSSDRFRQWDNTVPRIDPRRFFE